MDINGSEFLIIAILALILVGPERLPEYVRALRGVVLKVRALLRDGQDALKDELGADVDWNQLDPRNYDPRRIVREALFDDQSATTTTGTSSSAGLSAGAATAGAVGMGAVGTGAAPTGSRGGRRRATQAGVGGQAGAAGPVTRRAPFDPEAT